MSRFTRFWRMANTARLAAYLMALWKLARHAETPLAPKLVAWLVLGYALSPIDLIPDFIPVLGQLDDMLLVPLGVALVVRLTPRPLWAACMQAAEAQTETLPKLWWGLLLVLLIWALLFVAFVAWLVRTVWHGV